MVCPLLNFRTGEIFSGKNPRNVQVQDPEAYGTDAPLATGHSTRHRTANVENGLAHSLQKTTTLAGRYSLAKTRSLSGQIDG